VQEQGALATQAAMRQQHLGVQQMQLLLQPTAHQCLQQQQPSKSSRSSSWELDRSAAVWKQSYHIQRTQLRWQPIGALVLAHQQQRRQEVVVARFQMALLQSCGCN
jgi:hypothetical protein